MKVAICCEVYLFGVTGLYFFVVNNQAFTVDPKCHCNILPTSKGTQLRRMRQRVRTCCFNEMVQWYIWKGKTWHLLVEF